MAPEVIQEIGYDCLADIWSLGITSIEMAEMKPPYANLHPMRAIFLIPISPAPTFDNPSERSAEFIDFSKKCLVKNPSQRATASRESYFFCIFARFFKKLCFAFFLHTGGP